MEKYIKYKNKYLKKKKGGSSSELIVVSSTDQIDKLEEAQQRIDLEKVLILPDDDEFLFGDDTVDGKLERPSRGGILNNIFSVFKFHTLQLPSFDAVATYNK